MMRIETRGNDRKENSLMLLKRTIPLLLVFAIVFAAAPQAEATHCVRCRFTIEYSYCFYGANVGRTECDDSSGVCVLSGNPCNHLSAANTPLATEYQVASVERIDEAPAPNEALVAALEAPQPVPAEATR